MFGDERSVAVIKVPNGGKEDVQGNIIALLDANGKVVVEYVYDAWGNYAVLDANGNDLTDSSHIGNRNPFRYRGYFYDVETGLYYLQTRYYDPEIGRFLNMDDISYADPEQFHGLNLYAYCGNDPVNKIDIYGNISIKIGRWATALEYFSSISLGVLGGIAKNANRIDLFNNLSKLALKSSKFIQGIGVVSIAIDSIISFTSSVQNGTSTARAISDTVTDIAIDLGTMAVSSVLAGAVAGAIGGSAVPIVGNIIGFFAGLAVGIGTALIDYYLPQIRQGIKDFVYSIGESINEFFNRIGNFFDRIF